MTHTPDEIEKGLECCITDNCKECPYYPLYEVFGCKLARAKDALALIQQLEAQNAEKAERIKHTEERAHQLDLLNLGLLVEKAKLEAERDQAVEDLRNVPKMGVGNCPCCIHYNHGNGDNTCVVCGAKGMDCWQWRGVPEKEG